MATPQVRAIYLMKDTGVMPGKGKEEDWLTVMAM